MLVAVDPQENRCLLNRLAWNGEASRMGCCTPITLRASVGATLCCVSRGSTTFLLAAMQSATLEASKRMPVNGDLNKSVKSEPTSVTDFGAQARCIGIRWRRNAFDVAKQQNN